MKREREAIKAIKQAQRQVEEKELDEEAKRLASKLGVSLEYAKIYLKKQKRRGEVKKRLKKVGEEFGKKAWEFLEPVEKKPKKPKKSTKTPTKPPKLEGFKPSSEQGFNFSALIDGSFGQPRRQTQKKKQGNKKAGEDLFRLFGKW